MVVPRLDYSLSRLSITILMYLSSLGPVAHLLLPFAA